MNRNGHEGVDFFIGPEVEHTPAFSKRTLFVVGEQPVDKIVQLAQDHKTPHIFMGANHSFSANLSTYWDETITALIDKGYMVTLDYQAHEHVTVLSMLGKSVWRSRLFVPLLSVRVPDIQTSNVNLTIKIDDIDFDSTNAGVWCLHHHEVTDSNRFTSWNEYSTDQVIDANPAVVPEIAVTQPQVVETPVELNQQDVGLDHTEKAPAETVVTEPTTEATAAEEYASSAADKKAKKK